MAWYTARKKDNKDNIALKIDSVWGCGCGVETEEVETLIYLYK